MKTDIKNKSKRNVSVGLGPTEQLLQTAQLRRVAPAEISLSSFNYRKQFDQTALEDFAAELAVHGVLSPLLVRAADGARYELVAGERRLLAARIAGLETLPVLVADLTDEQAREVQLVENLQRENPHPLHEAQAIQQMQQTGKTIDEIAARLGKSKKFIYTRIKLSGPIEPHQQILMAGKMGVQQAYEIASLSGATQQEIYNQYCSGWQDEDFKMPSGYQISRFRCDLGSAPFDTNDNELVSDKGACSSCPLNSATLHSLFPELSNQAVCSGWECFQRKRRAHFTRQIDEVTSGFQPQAIVYTHAAQLEEISLLLSGFEELTGLPQYANWGLREILPPRMPELDNYMPAGSQDLTGEAEALFAAAVDDYEADLVGYEEAIASTGVVKGLLITDRHVRNGYFILSQQANSKSAAAVSAKDFQLAAKQGAVTEQIIQSEIERLTAKEQRSKEIDQQKIQLALHAAFSEGFAQVADEAIYTSADEVAVRLIVFHSLDYQLRYQVIQALGFSADALDKEHFYDTLAQLSPAEFAYMVRASLAGNSASKSPDNINGWCLRAVAENAGLDLAAIERAQQEIAETRSARFQNRLAEIEQARAAFLQQQKAA